MEKSSFQILTKFQARHIVGGSMAELTEDGGTCGFRVPAQNGYSGYIDCNVSKEEALAWVNEYGGNWCCDSCGSSSYCG